MRRLFTIMSVPALLAAVSLSLSGCVKYDPTPQSEKPVPAGVESWTKIPPRNWKPVSYHHRAEALSLLGKKDVMPLGKARYEDLMKPGTEGFTNPDPVEVPAGSQLYLVKGRGYGAVGGRMRFNRKTGELSAFLVMYNGEMSFPGMRWAVEDLPVIIALPQAPSKVHKSAEIGGDSIFHFMDRD